MGTSEVVECAPHQACRVPPRASALQGLGTSSRYRAAYRPVASPRLRDQGEASTSQYYRTARARAGPGEAHRLCGEGVTSGSLRPVRCEMRTIRRASLPRVFSRMPAIAAFSAVVERSIPAIAAARTVGGLLQVLTVAKGAAHRWDYRGVRHCANACYKVDHRAWATCSGPRAT